MYAKELEEATMSDGDYKLESGQFEMVKQAPEEKKEPVTWEEKYDDLLK